MSYHDLINAVRENAGEWLEMSENPDEIIIGILAKKIVSLQTENLILERRLHCKQHSTWE
jgi:hypothetical protein